MTTKIAMILATLAASSALGCGGERSSGGATAGTAAPTAAATAKPSQPAPADSSYACTRDSDCPSLACGPCKSGDVVKRSDVMVNCYRNPCPGTLAVCRAGACVVR